MSVNSFGDLAQGFAMRSRNTALKQDIQRLSLELSTGQTTDVRGKLAGNYSFLTDVDRKIEVMDSFRIATSEAANFTGHMQTVLNNFSDLPSDISSTLLSAGSSIAGPPNEEVSREAGDTLDRMISTLNSSFAGRSLFSGNATNMPALVDGDALLADLKTAMTGAATPADMLSAAQTWFADPAGFAATAYLGSADAMSPFALSPDDTLALDVMATDPEFAANLQAVAVAALAGDPAFGLTPEDQQELFQLTGQATLTGQNEITGLQARVGFAEQRIETITARNAAEASSLSIARNTLLSADPYNTATELEEVQFQLQSLYSVTVRMSQLSLVNYL